MAPRTSGTGIYSRDEEFLVQLGRHMHMRVLFWGGRDRHGMHCAAWALHRDEAFGEDGQKAALRLSFMDWMLWVPETEVSFCSWTISGDSKEYLGSYIYPFHQRRHFQGYFASFTFILHIVFKSSIFIIVSCSIIVFSCLVTFMIFFFFFFWTIMLCSCFHLSSINLDSLDFSFTSFSLSSFLLFSTS